jgi:hypothetical protein
MSYTIDHRQLRKIVAALFSATVLLSAVPALASAACPTTSSSTPFAKFGDSAAYSPLAGGSFESGAPGWTLSKAAVAAGNESYNVAPGSHSLAIQPTGVAVSPTFCVNTAEPSFRFFLRQTSGSWGVLNVVLRWTDSSGTSHDTTVASLQTGTSWQASPVLQLATTLPLTTSASAINAKLVFKPEPYGGAWAIDDVFVDPHSR